MTTAFLMIFVAAFGLAGFESIYSLYVNEVHQFGLGAIATVLTLNWDHLFDSAGLLL